MIVLSLLMAGEALSDNTRGAPLATRNEGDMQTPHENRRPIASIGLKPEANGIIGPLIYFSGETPSFWALYSYDPDGDPLTVHWKQLKGPAVVPTIVKETGPAALFYNFVAPETSETGPQEILLEMTVDDGSLVSEPLLISVWVFPNHAPVPIAGEDMKVLPGTEVILNGSKTYDPNFGVAYFERWEHEAGPAADNLKRRIYHKPELSYQWTQVAGPHVDLTHDTAPRSWFTVPENTAEGTIFEFDLEVADAYSVNRRTDRIRITVQKEGALVQNSGELQMNIPNRSQITHSIEVSDGGTQKVDTVSVRLNIYIEASFTALTEVNLICPDGRKTPVHETNDAYGLEKWNFRKDYTLSGCKGSPVNGTWTLEVIDQDSQPFETILHSWNLTIIPG